MATVMNYTAWNFGCDSRRHLVKVSCILNQEAAVSRGKKREWVAAERVQVDVRRHSRRQWSTFNSSSSSTVTSVGVARWRRTSTGGSTGKLGGQVVTSTYRLEPASRDFNNLQIRKPPDTRYIGKEAQVLQRHCATLRVNWKYTGLRDCW